jgi:hypothetical protein
MNNREQRPSLEENALSASPSFFEAVAQLPRQYFKMIIRPAVETLREQVGWARWSTVIVQFLLLVGITIGLNSLGHRIPGAALHAVAAASFGSFKLFGWLPAPYNGIVFILATFLIGLGTAYPFSKLSKGRGRFVEHTFILLLITVPLVTLSGALLLIPATGTLLSALILAVSMLFLYRMVLHVMTIMAVHELGAGQATLIVLIIPMLLALMAIIILVIVTLGHFLDGFDGFFDSLGSSKDTGKSQKRTRSASPL